MSSQRTEHLPFLPGNSFKDYNQTKFHVSNTLTFKNGYARQNLPTNGIGGLPLPKPTLDQSELDELANFKPELTYGKDRLTKDQEESNFVPAHNAFDKKVLKFNAYFKEAVHESPNEFYRVRPVEIYYYLEDDSIAVIEPMVENSGMPQGKLIKRQRLPKNEQGECWHWKDLNLAMNVVFYGRTFRLINCDQFTRDFLESEGTILCQCESVPVDPYTDSRKQPLRSYTTPSDFDKLKKFLELDRKVLKFYAVWDDRDAMFGETRQYLIHYYLVDDSVEIREVHQPNDGRDPFPVLLRRGKLPKNRYDVDNSFPMAVMELTEHEVSAWFTPVDFRVGATLFINGRKFLIYDCDEATRQYYRDQLQFEQGKLDINFQAKSPQVVHQIPPYNGFGSLEDSLQNCLSLVNQPPKKDFIKMLENDNKVLRYEAKMESSRLEDRERRFIISYRLADDMISIFEPPQRNSGIIGGKFLERTRIAKPNCDPENPVFYGIGDFAIGATVFVLKHRFIITNADEYVLKYLEANESQYPKETIESLRNGLVKKI
jgi:hypothetical protein